MSEPLPDDLFEGWIGDPRMPALSYDTSDTRRLEASRAWLEECVGTHESCKVSSIPAKGFLPKRLLKLLADGETARLVRTGKLAAGSVRYTALSHCWGVDPFITLTKKTCETLEVAIPYADLPKNFQDAISYTRTMGIEYLWIDSLCIIQDSEEDWLRESM